MFFWTRITLRNVKSIKRMLLSYLCTVTKFDIWGHNQLFGAKINYKNDNVAPEINEFLSSSLVSDTKIKI